MGPDLLTIISTVFLLTILPMYADTVRQPTIYVQKENEDSTCRNGCPDDYYCYEVCRLCSPCPDVNFFNVPNNQLTVMGECVRKGQCPNMCSNLHLRSHQQANVSICSGLLSSTPTPDCGLSCLNGGTRDDSNCRCLCDKDWTGSSCNDCELSCLNGGTLDDSNCRCLCDKAWTGSSCDDCELESCYNGGTLDTQACQCECSTNWNGPTCSDCKLESCDNEGTLDTQACQCSCSANWNGPTCSDCGLKSCQDGSTLDTTSCQCLCKEDGTGHNCFKPSEGGNPTKTNENFILYSISGVIVFAAVALVAWCFGTKLRLFLKRGSLSIDVEKQGLLECMEVCRITQRSISVKAKNPSKKFNGRKMRFSCREPGTSQNHCDKWSETKLWNIDGVLQHTFEELLPGVTYVISLHQHKDLQDPVKTREVTTYYPLSIEVSNSSATIKGLMNINAVKVCPCLMLPSCKSWIDIPPGQNEWEISNIPPGIEFCVKAGTVDSGKLQSEQTFRCVAEGTLHVEETAQNREFSSCTTFEKALKYVKLKKSLQLEFDSRDNPCLAEMVASALGLNGDDFRMIKYAKNEHVEKLDEILTSSQTGTHVHELIQEVLKLEKTNETELKQRSESAEFLIKVVGHTWTNHQCLECIHLLHQEHSV